MLRRLPAPDQRQTMLFSATLSHRVLELAYEHMNDPELVRIEPDKITADKVRQMIYFPAMEEKLPLLVGLLRADRRRRARWCSSTPRAWPSELEDAAARERLQCRRRCRATCRRSKRLRMLQRLPQRRARGADRHRRGLARPAHPGRQPRVQLRPAAGPRRLRASHRPHARAGAEGDAISFGCEDYAISLPDIEAFIGQRSPSAVRSCGSAPAARTSRRARWRRGDDGPSPAVSARRSRRQRRSRAGGRAPARAPARRGPSRAGREARASPAPIPRPRIRSQLAPAASTGRRTAYTQRMPWSRAAAEHGRVVVREQRPSAVERLARCELGQNAALSLGSPKSCEHMTRRRNAAGCRGGRP